jgi:hypothetical protein
VGDNLNDMATTAGQIPARRLISKNGVARAKSRAHFFWGLSVAQRNMDVQADTNLPKTRSGASALISGEVILPLICPESDITVVWKSRGFRPSASQEETAEISRN